MKAWTTPSHEEIIGSNEENACVEFRRERFGTHWSVKQKELSMWWFFEQEADGELTTTLQWEKEIKSDNGKIFLMTLERSWRKNKSQNQKEIVEIFLFIFFICMLLINKLAPDRRLSFYTSEYYILFDFSSPLKIRISYYD